MRSRAHIRVEQHPQAFEPNKDSVGANMINLNIRCYIKWDVNTTHLEP